MLELNAEGKARLGNIGSKKGTTGFGSHGCKRLGLVGQRREAREGKGGDNRTGRQQGLETRSYREVEWKKRSGTSRKGEAVNSMGNQ